MNEEQQHDGKYLTAAKQIGSMVEEKNKNYNNSYNTTVDFLKLLYPAGVPAEQLTNAALMTRIFDKLKMIATNKNLFDEDPNKELLGIVTRLYVANERTKNED